MTRTKTTAPAKTEDSTMLEIVTYSLFAKGRLDSVRPITQPGCDVVDFHLNRHPAGWVAHITLDNPTPGAPTTIATPDATLYPTRRLAFFAGAALVCELLTGSPELPFFEANGNLLVAGYGTGGFKGLFLISRPVPWT